MGSWGETLSSTGNFLSVVFERCTTIWASRRCSSDGLDATLAASSRDKPGYRKEDSSLTYMTTTLHTSIPVMPPSPASLPKSSAFTFTLVSPVSPASRLPGNTSTSHKSFQLSGECLSLSPPANRIPSEGTHTNLISPSGPFPRGTKPIFEPPT